MIKDGKKLQDFKTPIYGLEYSGSLFYTSQRERPKGTSEGKEK
jgi:hypothetical protein